jgi:hypothetical protein
MDAPPIAPEATSAIFFTFCSFFVIIATLARGLKP